MGPPGVDLRTHEENLGTAEFWADHGGPDVLAMPVLSGQRLYPPDEMLRICTDAEHASAYMAQVYADLVDALPTSRPRAARQMLAQPHLLETALDRLLTQHRSIESYLDAAKVSTAGLRRARAVLSA